MAASINSWHRMVDYEVDLIHMFQAVDVTTQIFLTQCEAPFRAG